RLDRLLAGPERPAPGVEAAEQHGAVVVAEMAEQPPEPLGTAERAVGDDERARPDPRARRGRSEAVRRGQRMPAGVRHGEVGELLVDVEERGARNVTREVELAPATGRSELPAAVDELNPHGIESSGGLRSHAHGEYNAQRNAPS